MAINRIQEERSLIFQTRQLDIPVSKCWCLNWDSNLTSLASKIQCILQLIIIIMQKLDSLNK